MRYKLSSSQYKSLLHLFSDVVVPCKPSNMAERLLQSLLMQIYEKLYAKGARLKDKYTLSLSIAEAIAFYTFWTAYQFPKEAVFEISLITQINIQIHRTYGND